MPMRATLAIVCGGLLAQGVVVAQPEPDKAAPGPSATRPLSGPPVGAHASRGTIVSRDMDGRVRRPDVPAEEAAARALKLDPASLLRVEAVLDVRALLLERFVEDNLDLMTRLVTAESAPAKEKWWLADQALRRSTALRENGPLEQQIGAVLPEAQRARYGALLAEYWRAVGAEGVSGPDPKGRLGAVLDEKFKSLGREVEAAYRRCEKGGGLLYHYFFDSLTLTPEQSRQLRRVCAEYALGGVDNRDKQSQGALLVSVMQVLTPEQRVAIGKKFNGGKPTSVKPEKAKTTTAK